MRYYLLLLSLLSICIMIACDDKQEETKGNFKFSDAKTLRAWQCSCDNNCLSCDCQTINGGAHQIFTSGSINDHCKLLPDKSTSSGNGPSNSSAALVKFSSADGATNSYGFDDWINADGTTNGNGQICYLTVEGGCHAAVKVNIRINEGSYDHFEASISSDQSNSLSFDPNNSVLTTNVSNGDTLTLYSRNETADGEAWIEIAGHSRSGSSTCLAGNRNSGCFDAEDQLKITVAKKNSMLLPLALVSQGDNNCACQVAVGCMALQWYYRQSAHDMNVEVTLDQALNWIWGVNSDKKASEGVPLLNMLGSYNTLCAKTEPQAGTNGCLICDDKNSCATTCEADNSGYDETVNRCSYVGWVPSGNVDYKGKWSYVGSITSYRFGINSMLKTAHYKFASDNLSIPSIGSKCWGSMDPQTVVAQINKGIPIPIWYGQIIKGADSHSIIICGYVLDNGIASAQMLVAYLDPIDRNLEYHYVTWQSLLDRGWHQSIYLLSGTSFLTKYHGYRCD